jgi:ribosomal protein L3 glutamine methyltransferase
MSRVGDVIEDLAARFSEAGLVYGHGTDNAWDEAVALVLGVTGLPDDRSVLDRPVSAAEQARVAELAVRRIEQRVPVAYLLGGCRFAGLEFLIEPGVVIPRSPIGALIQDHFAPWLARDPETIIDLCCGSGCLGIAAALAFPSARVDLIDIDPVALDVARRNVELHRLGHRVRVHPSDLFEALSPGRWDLILSNPPYVDGTDMGSLPPEYRHEPVIGLAGGRDGLDVVVRLLDALPQRLASGGLFVCEVGGSAAALCRRFPRTPFVWPELPDGGEGVFLLSGDSTRPG